MKGIYQYLSAGLTVLLLSACQQPDVNDSEEFQVPVRVAKVGVASMENQIVTSGSLRATQVATLAVEISGTITIGKGENGSLDEGDQVEAGDVLGSISGEDLKLSVKREVVKQRLESAKSNLEASEKAIANQLTSLADHNYLKDNYEEARLEYQRSLNTEAQSQIRSPIDGVILRYFRDKYGQRMANGQRVDIGEEVARVAPLDTLIADIQLVSRDIARVQKGISAKISSNVWIEKVFEGEVLRLSPTVDDTTRTLQAQVRVDNKESLLKPGMLVEVTLVLEKKENVPVIPTSALAERGGRQVVFVQNGLRVEQRPVNLGIRQGQQVEILEGLVAGESVVVLGHETLADQMPVQVMQGGVGSDTIARNYTQ